MRRTFALLCAFVLSGPLLAETPATFITASGSVLPLRVLESEGKVWAAVRDVAAPLEGTISFDEETRSYEVRLGSHTAIFGLDAPIAVVDTKLVNLTATPRSKGGIAFADPDFFSRIFGPMTGLDFAWDPGKRALVASRPATMDVVVEASVTDVGETTKVVLRFSRPPQYRVEKGSEALVLKFPGARLVPAVPEKDVNGPLVLRVVLRAGEVVIALREPGLSTNVYPLGGPPRLVVDVARAAAGAAPIPGTAQAAATAPRGRTIVLDPGHGGTEEGARGPSGLLEKDATLALSKTIQEVLVRHGYRVVTTRSSDASVSLEDRAAAANAAKADVFVSLHANASRSAEAHGTEVYYLSLDASDRAAALLAESENRMSETPTAEKNAALRDLDLILWDLAQNQHLAASERLAEIIQADFNRLLGVTTRGVKQAPLRVLIGVNAPAVLVEVAFVTNSDEERKLASEEFRRQTAETLAGSLDTFFRTAAAVPPVPYATKPPGRP